MPLLSSMRADWKRLSASASGTTMTLPGGDTAVGGWQTVATSGNGKLTLYSNPVFNSNVAMRFYLGAGDDPINSSGIRNEHSTSFGDDEYDGSDAWYVTTFLLPSGDPYGRGDPDWTSAPWEIPWQIHGSQGGLSPPLCIHCDSDGASQGRVYVSTRNSSNVQTKHILASSIPTNTWLKFIIYNQYRSDGVGSLLRVWYATGANPMPAEGSPNIERSGFSNWYPGDNGGYRKFGIYSGSEGTSRVVYHSGYARLQSYAQCLDWLGSGTGGGGGTTFSIVPYPSTSVQVSQTQQFTANLSPVTWSVSPSGTGGTISAGGLYTAPASVPTPNTAVVTGTNAGVSRTTTVTITPPPAPPSYDARLAGILLGGKSPTDGAAGTSMDKFKGTGVLFIADRHAPDDTAYRAWLVSARAAGTETLYYTCPSVMHDYVSATDSEDARIYGGTNQAAVFSLHPDWFWSWQTGMNPQDFTEDGIGWLTNMRPGSSWIEHFVAWAADFYANRSLHTGATIFNGLLLDLCGNDMPVTPTNWSASYADLWTEGCHELVRKLRTTLGPDVLLVANAPWHRRREVVFPKDISTITPVDNNNRASMLKGGHPDLNGRMFEEIQRWSGGTALVKAQIDKDPVTTPVALAPDGYQWAEPQSGRVTARLRFVGFDYSNTLTTSIEPYVDVGAIDAPHSIGFLNGAGPTYQSYAQTTVPGVVTNQELLNHVPNSWVYAGSDTTPPLPGSVGSVSYFNGTITISYTLPVDTDRDSTILARKSAPWQGTDTHLNGTVVTTLTPGAAGDATYQESGVAAGTWYYKVFTIDAGGNVNRDSNVVSLNVPSTPPDNTPPQPPSAISASVAGQALTVEVTLVEDTDRTKLVLARKTSAWTGGQSYTAGVVMETLEPGGDGVNTITETGLGSATYYIKAFTEDQYGNVNTTGPDTSATIAPPSPQGSGRIGHWPRRSPVVGHTAGRATFSGTGAVAAFVIPHGLGATPRTISVTGGSADADGDFYATADATNITVTFVASPPAGDSNVVLNWTAEM